MDVNKTIMNTLKDIGVPVSFLICDEEPKPQLYVTFLEVLATEGNYADDKPTTEEINVQVDIWSKFGVSIADTRKMITIRMKNAGWTLSNVSPDLYEVDTKTLHKALEFKYEREVE